MTPHHDQLLGAIVGQRSDQHRLRHGEHRGVGADAQRQRQHDDGGKAGCPGKQAQREGQILADLVEEPSGAPLFLLALALRSARSGDGDSVAETTKGLGPGVRRRPPPVDEFLRAHVEVKGQLDVDVCLHVGAPESQVAAPDRCLRHRDLAHTGCSFAVRTRPTASANRTQLAVSVRSLPRPSAVNR